MAGSPKPHIVDASVLIDLEHGLVIKRIISSPSWLDCA